MKHATRMSEFSKDDTAVLVPIAESIQPLFALMLSRFIPAAISAGVDGQLAVGFLTVGLNAQLASLLAVMCEMDGKTSESHKDDFYAIGSEIQQTMATSVAELIQKLNRKQTEGN